MQNTGPIKLELKGDELLKALESGDRDLLREKVAEIHPADLAPLFLDLEEHQKNQFLTLLEYRGVGSIIDSLPFEQVQELLLEAPRYGQRELLHDLADDDLVDLFQTLDQETREKFFPLLTEEKRKVAQSLLRFPENSAGGRMTTAFATVRKNQTIGEAINELRRDKERIEILARIYVVDQDNHLIGKVRLRDLAFADHEGHVADICDDDTLAIDAYADQEEASHMIAKYDLVALPVVNHSNVLLGIITHDDAMEIVEEESTEDLERMSAISQSKYDENYLHTTVLSQLQRRLPWVVTLALLALISGYVLHAFEDVLTSTFILAIYMPMVVAAGGNTGSQAATMVIRAMALGELPMRAFVQVAWKELRVGAIIGAFLGLIIAIKIRFFTTQTIDLPSHLTLLDVAITVAIALLVQIATSTLLGAILPMLARAVKLDPATVAAPAITTLVDVSGLTIYFYLAKIYLHL